MVGKSPLLLKTVPDTEEPLYKRQLPPRLSRMRQRDTVEISPRSLSSQGRDRAGIQTQVFLDPVHAPHHDDELCALSRVM